MGAGYLILSSIVFSLLVYALIRLRLSSLVEERITAYYGAEIKADIQEFYRELESYAAVLENRIGRFKTLIEREQIQFQSYRELAEKLDRALATLEKTKKGKEIAQLLKEASAQNAQSADNKEQLEKLATETRAELTGLKTEIDRLKAALNDRDIPVKPGHDRHDRQATKGGLTSESSSPEDGPGALGSSPAPGLPGSPKEPNPFDQNLNEFSIAEELIDDLLLEGEFPRHGRRTQAEGPAKPASDAPAAKPFDPAGAPASMASTAKDTGKKSPGIASSIASSLASIGKVLMPALDKPAASSAGTLPETAERSRNDARQNRPGDHRDFNELITKNMTDRPRQTVVSESTPREAEKPKTAPAESPARLHEEIEQPFRRERPARQPVEKKATAPKEPAPQNAPRPEKEMEPTELLALIEALKRHRGGKERGEALKTLLEKGFEMPQVSELSGVPQGDLELMLHLHFMNQGDQGDRASSSEPRI